MAKKPLFRTDMFPYHLSARANNKEWFYLPKQEVWKIFIEKLAHLETHYRLSVQIFVLMSNHFHMIASTPLSNIDEIMQWLLRETSKEINKKAERINHVFGGPYKWSVIQHSFYYKHAFRYVAQNPLKEGICNRVEEYPFSTLYYMHHNLDLPFKISESVYCRQQFTDKPIWSKLEWLNTPYQAMEYDKIRLALRRYYFQFAKK